MTPEKAKQLEEDMERLRSIPLQEVECELRSDCAAIVDLPEERPLQSHV